MTTSASALEAYVIAKRLQKQNLAMTIANVNNAVPEVFGILPDNPEGRIKPFSCQRVNRIETNIPQWGLLEESGRKTVWTVGSRRGSAAQELFVDQHIKNGLINGAESVLATTLLRRGGQAIRPSRQALAVFLTRNQNFDSAPNESAVMDKLNALFGISLADLALFAANEPLQADLSGLPEWNASLLPDGLKPPSHASLGSRAANIPVSPTELVIDERVRRMVRLAVLSAPAVMLVGPPGTGKTALLDEVLREISNEPRAFGFSSDTLAPPIWVTPEESWAAQDLVGGKTVDEKGRLRFRPGYVLDAIRQDKWLILDEANRADMDKIFGALLTWLSNRAVELGRATTDLNSPRIELGWALSADCDVERVEELEAEEPSGDPIRFLAGTVWKLLGTYNALDAQRVFRFGQALGRRFLRVPIPCPTEDEFLEALEPRVAELPSETLTRITAIYAAHLESPATTLGPALFLRMATYIAAGLDIPAVEADSPADESDTSSGAAHSGSADTPGSNANLLSIGIPDPEFESLLAEAYVVNVGTWVATLDEADLALLGERITDSGGLTKDQWKWVTKMLPALG